MRERFKYFVAKGKALSINSATSFILFRLRQHSMISVIKLRKISVTANYFNVLLLDNHVSNSFKLANDYLSSLHLTSHLYQPFLYFIT